MKLLRLVRELNSAPSTYDYIVGLLAIFCAFVLALLRREKKMNERITRLQVLADQRIASSASRLAQPKDSVMTTNGPVPIDGLHVHKGGWLDRSTNAEVALQIGRNLRHGQSG